MGGNTWSMLSKETPDDVFWFENFNTCILYIVKELEDDAYKYIKSQGLSRHLSSTNHKLTRWLLGSGIVEHPGGAIRTGAVFRTPLSQEPHRFNAENLSSYLEAHCGDMGKARVYWMGILGRFASQASNLIPLKLFKKRFAGSSNVVRDFLTRADCREVFCRQLSDQLIYCQECSERPILHNILKDEDAMRIHLTGHHESSDARKAMNDLLLSI